MSDPVQDLFLPGGIVISESYIRGFLWAGDGPGAQWLATVSSMVSRICQEFSIELSTTLPELSMNLVLFGEAATRGSVVLKLAPPHEDVTNEIATLSLMDGNGYARLIAANKSEGWSLQERILPGTTLQSLVHSGEISDGDATTIVADLITRSPVISSDIQEFPDLRRWLRSLFDYAESILIRGPLPQVQVNLALRHAESILLHPGEPRLLHGDLHHGNIIKSNSGWTIIDPKGLVADQSFEIAPWFYNPVGIDARTDLVNIFSRRLDILEENLRIDRMRLWQCAFVGSVLSDCWSLESGSIANCHSSTITAALMELPERSR